MEIADQKAFAREVAEAFLDILEQNPERVTAIFGGVLLKMANRPAARPPRPVIVPPVAQPIVEPEAVSLVTKDTLVRLDDQPDPLAVTVIPIPAPENPPTIETCTNWHLTTEVAAKLASIGSGIAAAAPEQSNDLPASAVPEPEVPYILSETIAEPVIPDAKRTNKWGDGSLGYRARKAFQQKNTNLRKKGLPTLPEPAASPVEWQAYAVKKAAEKAAKATTKRGKKSTAAPPADSETSSEGG